MLKTPSLILNMEMEGNATDSSGNNHSTTVSGATLTTGKFGQCYAFSNSYISVANADDLNLGQVSGKQFTISLWYKRTDYGVVFLFAKDSPGDSTGNTDYSVWFEGGYLYLALGGGGSYAGISEPQMNTWHHLAVTLIMTNTTTTTVKMYVDGILSMNTTFTNKAAATSYPLYIGSGNGGGYPFIGNIDRFQIYNKALSQSDIKRVMMGLHPLNG